MLTIDTKKLIKNFITDNLRVIKRTYYIRGFKCVKRGIYKKATNHNIYKMINSLNSFNSQLLPKNFDCNNYTLKRLYPFNLYSVNIDNLFKFTFQVDDKGRFNNIVVYYLNDIL